MVSISFCLFFRYLGLINVHQFLFLDLQFYQVTILSSHISTELEKKKIKSGDEMLNLLHFTSLTVNCSMSAASNFQLASSIQALQDHTADKGIIYQYCRHISPHPKITYFEKLLLNNTLKEYGFSPTFHCIHQLCLFPARNENK